MPLPGLILLALAAVCQFLIVCLCLREFSWLLSRRNAENAEANPRSQTAVGLPGTIAVVLQAALFNCALFVLTLPGLLQGNLQNGLLMLAGAGFAAVGLSSFVTSLSSKSRMATAQLGLSAFGLVCLFLPYYLWVEG